MLLALGPSAGELAPSLQCRPHKRTVKVWLYFRTVTTVKPLYVYAFHADCAEIEPTRVLQRAVNKRRFGPEMAPQPIFKGGHFWTPELAGVLSSGSLESLLRARRAGTAASPRSAEDRRPAIFQMRGGQASGSARRCSADFLRFARFLLLSWVMGNLEL